MFEAWGRFVYRRRRLVLLVAAVAVAAAAVWGTGVFARLQSGGGFTPPGSQSQQASDLATRAFGRDTADVVVLYRSPGLTVRDPAYRAARHPRAWRRCRPARCPPIRRTGPPGRRNSSGVGAMRPTPCSGWPAPPTAPR